MQSWYLGVDLKKINYYPSALPARSFTTDEPKREFVERLIRSGFYRETAITFDRINYMRSGKIIQRSP